MVENCILGDKKIKNIRYFVSAKSINYYFPKNTEDLDLFENNIIIAVMIGLVTCNAHLDNTSGTGFFNVDVLLGSCPSWINIIYM